MINDSTIRSDVFTTIKNSLTSASLIASDVSNSSIPVNITAQYSNKSNNLPEVVISNAAVSNNDKIFFNNGFDSNKIISVQLDVYARRIPHIDQISDQIYDYFRTNSINGFPLVGWDEDYELQEPNNNRIHHKSLFLTFKKR